MYMYESARYTCAYILPYENCGTFRTASTLLPVILGKCGGPYRHQAMYMYMYM